MLLDHSAYELREESGKLRGEFNKRHLRLYQEADDETQIHINKMKLSQLTQGRTTG